MRALVSTLLLLALALPIAHAQKSPEEAFPATHPDPLVGDYVGRWSADVEVDPEIAAQVIPLGRDRYQVRVQSKLDMRCPPHALVEVEKVDGVLKVDERGFYCEIKEGVITGGEGRSGRKTFEMKKVERLSPTLGAKAPEGASVLFDGTNLDAWTNTQGWTITSDGFLMVTPDGEYLTTKNVDKDGVLHIEFRTPWMPSAREQQRGNSGVFLQDVYEVQVLDSYGLEGYNNECGALYKVSAPKVNACAPPLQWQTYDIKYRAPRYEGEQLVENPRITVWHNGVLIHHEQEMPWITAWTEAERLKPAPKEAGPIKLQGHNNYVQYRNIWFMDTAPEGWPHSLQK